MTSYNVEIEFAIRDNTDGIDDSILDRYEGLSAVVSLSPRGWVSVIVSIESHELNQAIRVALALSNWPVVSVEGMTSKEFDRRVGQGVPVVPPLLSVGEVAEMLGVSRQAIQQRIESGSLPARRVGRSWVIPTSTIR